MPWGAPVVDVSSNIGFDAFVYLTHSFRMPLFFLIAGYFARLLYQKRGLRGFVQNRFMRIVVPLCLGWLVLHPLTVMAWNLDTNASGANLTEFPVLLQLKMMLAQGLMFVPPARGGLFDLNHLWFLYYLVYLYAMALAARLISLKISLLTLQRADRLTARLVRSPAAIAALAVGTGLFLWRMDGWNGVDTPSDSLIPSLPVLLFYAAPFVFGWMLHRQPGLLQEFQRGWKKYLASGLALGCILFGMFYSLSGQGVTLGASGSMYPDLWPTQVTDWPHFISTLQSAARPDTPPALASFWKHVPEWDRNPILSLPPDPAPSVKIGLCRNLNRLLVIPDLFASGHPEDATLYNRHKLEKIFGSALRTDPRDIPWYGQVKLVYSMGYGLVMWLLVYSALGFFQSRFSAHSPAVRYISDSSYWIYLIHLPIILALEGWMFSWPWPGLVKFALLLSIFFAVAFASYHAMVRSTIVGAVLNGKRHKNKGQL